MKLYNLLLIAFISVLMPCMLHAGTVYYVAQSSAGGNTGADCANAKSISWFNSNAVAGDTAVICAGETISTGIVPINSGSPGQPITYQSHYEYNGTGNQHDSIITVSSGYGCAYLTGQDHITYDGLYFNDCGDNWINTEGGKSDYIEINNNKFYKARSWSGILVAGDSDYGRIINNVFLDAPRNTDIGEASCATPPYDCDTDCDSPGSNTWPADIIQFSSGSKNGGDYWVVEGNRFGDSSHDSVYMYTNTDVSSYTVIRDNIVVNGYHVGLTPNHLSLVEGNTIAENGIRNYYNPDSRDRCDKDDPGIVMNRGTSGGGSIIRRNMIISTEWGISWGVSTQRHYIYNNTLYNNWWHINRLGGGDVYPNYFVNNIIYSDGNIITHDIHNNLSGETHERRIFRDHEDVSGLNYIINNMWTPGDDTFYVKDQRTTPKSLALVISQYPTEWHSSNYTGTPDFIDPRNDETADLSLRSTSDAINAGTWLTTEDDGRISSGATLYVEDASFFYDGWGIPGETGDTIKTESGQRTIIHSIDYTNNIITLVSPITYINGEGVALAYSGSAPDIGAHEYTNGDTTPPTKPTGLNIIE